MLACCSEFQDGTHDHYSAHGHLGRVAGKFSFEHQPSVRTTLLHTDHNEDLQRCSGSGNKGLRPR